MSSEFLERMALRPTDPLIHRWLRENEIVVSRGGNRTSNPQMKRTTGPRPPLSSVYFR